MIIVVYHAGGGKGLLQLRQRDAAVNAAIHLEVGANLRVLDGSVLEDVATALDSRLPPTIEDFDRLYPDQPAIVK